MLVDVAIIGAGPAGMSAALQLKRSGVGFLLFEKSRPGGLLLNANLVENYPGFPAGISGEELVNLFKEHIDALGIEIQNEEVTRIKFEAGVFSIKASGRNLEARIVVLATGTSPIELKDFEIPEDCLERVFHEVAPIPNVAGQKITIVGAGDAAYDYALNLSRKNEVLILNRGDTTKCLALLQERASGNPSIENMEHTVIKEIRKTDGSLQLKIENSGVESSHDTNYLVLATGREVRFDFLDDKLSDRIAELERIDLLIRIGDIRHGMYRQVGICVGDGILSAMKICEKLKELNR